MATKKKGGSGQRMAKRMVPAAQKKKDMQTPPQVEPAATRAPERIQEKDAGFGVIKIGAGVLIFLILGSGALLKFVGGEDNTRGDKLPGELCEGTVECASGSICYSYKEQPKRCMTVCPQGTDCSIGYTCTSAAQRSGRKSTRIRAVCVENAKL